MAKFIPALYAVQKCLSRKQFVPKLSIFRTITFSHTLRNDKVPIIVEMDGRRIETNAKIGLTLRDVIADIRNGEDFGICDGTVACSTCHVTFSENDFEKIPFEPSQEEIDVLDVVPNYTDTSRLSCAINISPELKGMVIRVPEIRSDARILETQNLQEENKNKS